jgi:hypothetical protein
MLALAALGPEISREAAEAFADHRFGMDARAHAEVQPWATLWLAGVPEAEVPLREAAAKWLGVIARLKRIDPRTEALRAFCGYLWPAFRMVVSDYVLQRLPLHKAWLRCRRFVLAVFDEAGIEAGHLRLHSERLLEYLAGSPDWVEGPSLPDSAVYLRWKDSRSKL